MIAPGSEPATREARATMEGSGTGAEGSDVPARPSRDPEIQRKNRRLALLCVGICLVMAACGFVYVRWMMMRPTGTH